MPRPFLQGAFMTGKEAIKSALQSTQFMLNQYIGDLSDADLLVRPVPTANHPAWQLGHLIGGDYFLIKSQLPDANYPDLPAGFKEQYDGKNSGADKGYL